MPRTGVSTLFDEQHTVEARWNRHMGTIGADHRCFPIGVDRGTMVCSAVCSLGRGGILRLGRDG